MNSLSGAFKSRTVWFGLAIAVLSWVQSVVADAGLTSQQVALVGTLIGGATVWLRGLTTTSLADKSSS
jgi:hypothetical protein